MRPFDHATAKLARRRRPAERKRPTFDTLEGRLLMATRIWSGNSPVNGNWADARNWVGNQLPTNGDDLEFPAGANRLISTNNLSLSTVNALKFTFGGTGFVLNGNTFEIGAGGIADSSTTSTNTVNLGLRLPGGFPGSQTQVVNAGVLRLGGPITTARITGSSNLNKSGAGELILAGTSANTFRGTTSIAAGSLTLSKTGATAVPGALIAGDGISSARIVLTADNQIADTSAVTLNSGSKLDLNQHDDAIGSLTATSAVIATGSGVLTLNGNVLVKTASAATNLNGILSLGNATRTFTVQTGATLNLSGETRSGFLGAGVTKQGEGTMRLGGDNQLLLGIVRVNEGTLILQAGSNQDAVVAPVVVGDGVGVDRLVNGTPSQLGPSASVTINSSGVYDVGAGETIPGLTMNGGLLTLSASAGGLIRFTGDITATSDAAGNPAIIEIAQIDLTGVSVSNSLTATVNDGPGDVDLQIKSNLIRRTPEFDASFSKTGAGTLAVSGSNTITDMFMNAGRLLIDGVQRDTFTTASGAGSILGGRGLMGRVQLNRGVIYSPGSPDAGPGILTSANLDFKDPGVVYRVQLNGLVPGTQYDQARLSGTVNMNSLPRLELSLNFQPTTGDTFTIIDNLSTATNSTTGRFEGLPEGSHLSVGGWDFTITYRGGTDNNDVVLTYNGVRAPNEAPTIDRIAPRRVREGDALEFRVPARDANNDLLSYRLAPGAPAGATIDPTSGVFRWTPPRRSRGVHRATVVVTDNGPAHASVSQTFLIIVRRGWTGWGPRSFRA